MPAHLSAAHLQSRRGRESARFGSRHSLSIIIIFERERHRELTRRPRRARAVLCRRGTWRRWRRVVRLGSPSTWNPGSAHQHQSPPTLKQSPERTRGRRRSICLWNTREGGAIGREHGFEGSQRVSHLLAAQRSLAQTSISYSRLREDAARRGRRRWSRSRRRAAQSPPRCPTRAHRAPVRPERRPSRRRPNAT